MTRTTTHRIAGLLVLGLVLTSLPARVWLFGACPVCGQIHVPILVAYVGGDPTPDSDPSDDPPTSPDDDRAPDGCFVPLPYCPTPPPELPVASFPSGGELRPESDPRAVPLPTAALIRPPRA